jgi:hypothetical protein
MDNTAVRHAKAYHGRRRPSLGHRLADPVGTQATVTCLASLRLGARAHDVCFGCELGMFDTCGGVVCGVKPNQAIGSLGSERQYRALEQ